MTRPKSWLYLPAVDTGKNRSMDSQKFIVISSGHVLPDFTVEQVAQNLAKHYKKPIDVMIDMLICGEPRKVKSMATRAQAKSKCAQLSSLGLRCYFTELGNDGSDQPSMYTRASYMDDTPVGDVGDLPPPEDVAEPHVGDEPEHSEMFDEAIFDEVLAQAASGRTKKVLLIVVLPILLIAGLLGGGYFLFTTLLSSQVPQAMVEVESALYEVNEPSVMAYANLKQLKRIANITGYDQLQRDSMQAMRSAQFLQPLARGNYLFEHTDFISASVNVDSAQGSVSNEWLTVLLGRFDAQLVQEQLSSSYELDSASPGIFKLKHVSKLVGGVICPLDSQAQLRQSSSYIYVGDEKVIFASDLRLLNRLLRSIRRAGDFDRTSNAPILAQWQSYRQGSLLATQFFTPSSIEQNPIANLVLNAVNGNVSFDSVGMRVETALVNRGVRLELDGFSSDSRVIENAGTIIERGIRTHFDDAAPSLAKLKSRLSVTTGDAITIAVTLNSALLHDAKALASDVLSELIGDIGGNERDIVPEKITSKPWDYTANLELVSALNVDANAQFTLAPSETYQPLFTKGNAAVFVESIGQIPAPTNSVDQANPVQVALKVKRQVPANINAMSWGESGVIQRLMITDVLNGEGQQLIADEHCKSGTHGLETNQQASAQSSLNASKLDTSKSVRLNSGSSISDIAQVKGWSEIVIPTQIEKSTLSMDGARDANWEGGSLRLYSIKGSAVSYKMSGEQDNFISMRGRNAAGQVLSAYSSMSSGNNVVKTFAGEVAMVDVFSAADWYKNTIEFELDSLTPGNVSKSPPSVVKDDVSLFTAAGERNFNRALMLDWMTDDERAEIEQILARQGYSFDGSKESEIGRARSKSAHIFLKYDAENTWQKKLQGLILVPFEPATLQGSKSLMLRLSVDGVEHDSVVPAFSASSVNGRYVPDFESSKRSYSIGTFTLELDPNKVPAKISEITGTLDYRLPTSISTTSINGTKLESSRSITLRSIEYGLHAKTTYLVDKRISNFYSAKLFTADGSEHRADVASDPDGNTTVAFSTDQPHKKIELYRIIDSVNKRERFSLTPRYN